MESDPNFKHYFKWLEENEVSYDKVILGIKEFYN